MTSNELKELVKEHFSLVEAPAETTEEVVETEEQMSAEPTEEVAVEEVVEEAFGEIKDENGAFTLVFPGESLEVGDDVKVKTTEGQELSAPDGEHKLEGGITIKTEGGKVVEIMETESMAEEADEEEKMEVEVEVKEEDKMEVESVIEAIAEAVKAEMEAIKDEMKYLKEKVEKMEEAPATEKSAPANFSALNSLGEAEVKPFNQDRFEAVMARFKK